MKYLFLVLFPGFPVPTRTGGLMAGSLCSTLPCGTPHSSASCRCRFAPLSDDNIDSRKIGDVALLTLVLIYGIYIYHVIGIFSCCVSITWIPTRNIVP